MKKEGKDIGEGIGISGFTLGILSILLVGYIGLPIAVTGFVFCFFQQKKNPTKLGKTGVILNIIGFVLGLITIFWLYPLLSQI